ncbi:hypothetical protein Glove_71g189 [Diversispora epigaea]|uniref:Uncharacterized protein n=1 Tax=Diversispora epigaea TaxID=1348612 RepID=A0A397JDB0_9GLOM|nr:hypothetical protein Glove_71g189 [Diversispora epigaea]
MKETRKIEEMKEMRELEESEKSKDNAVKCDREIDKFIQQIQLNAKKCQMDPFDRLENIPY